MADPEIVVTAPRTKRPFDLSEFRSNVLDKGVMRTQFFYVTINNPPALVGAFNTRDLTLRCEAAALPGIDLTDASQGPRYGYGPAEFIPSNIAIRPITLTFVLDEGVSVGADNKGGSDVQAYFMTWLNSIVNFHNPGGTAPSVGNKPSTTVTHKGTNYQAYEVGYRDDYATSVDITVLNAVGEKTTTVKLYQAFPINVSPVELSWGENDQIARIQVTMTYRSFEYNMTLDT